MAERAERDTAEFIIHSNSAVIQQYMGLPAILALLNAVKFCWICPVECVYYYVQQQHTSCGCMSVNWIKIKMTYEFLMV